jgi:hypothetical protein
MGRSSYGKRAREQAKKVKAEQKRQRRLAVTADPPTDELGEDRIATDSPARPGETGLSTVDLLNRIEEIHRRHDAGEMRDDDFEVTKSHLLSQLEVD